MRRFVLAVLGFIVSAATGSAQFISPTLVVLRVGSDTSVTVRNYNPSTSLFGTDLVLPSTGASAVTISGTAVSEGALSVSSNGLYFGFTGYRTGTNGSGTDRVIVRYDALTGSVNTASAIPNSEGFGGNNIRGAAWSDDGSRYWASGAGTGGGTRTNTFQSTSGSTQVSTTVQNNRGIGINNGQLYTTSMSNPNVGFSQVGTGLPTTTGNTTTLFTSTGTSGTGTPSPYGFVLSPNGLTLYLADDRTIANGGGIQKWTRADAGSPFALATTFATGTGSTVGARGVTVDFSTANPTVYATTAEPTANRLISFSDVSGTATSFVTIDVASSNTIYRGVAFTPVPEPTTFLGLTVGAIGLTRFGRRIVRRA
jgi:hypothetical protein